MIGLFILMMVVWLLVSLVHAHQSKEVNIDNPYEEKCPPHRWRWDEVKNQQGETIQWKIVCDNCGPLNLDNDT